MQPFVLVQSVAIVAGRAGHIKRGMDVRLSSIARGSKSLRSPRGVPHALVWFAERKPDQRVGDGCSERTHVSAGPSPTLGPRAADAVAGQGWGTRRIKRGMDVRLPSIAHAAKARALANRSAFLYLGTVNEYDVSVVPRSSSTWPH